MPNNIFDGINAHKVLIDDVPLYIDGLETSGDDRMSISGISSTALNLALTPVAKIANCMITMAKENEINEVEVSLQLSLSMESETPIFKVLSTGANAQFCVKVKWNKNDK